MNNHEVFRCQLAVNKLLDQYNTGKVLISFEVSPGVWDIRLEEDEEDKTFCFDFYPPAIG